MDGNRKKKRSHRISALWGRLNSDKPTQDTDSASDNQLVPPGKPSYKASDTTQPIAQQPISQELWSEAYDKLKKDQQKLVQSYEMVLSEQAAPKDNGKFSVQKLGIVAHHHWLRLLSETSNL
jgi:hypothetical protein